MLQDLVIALYGIPGAIFEESSERDDNASSVDVKLIPVSDNLPFVPPGEFALYRELLSLGSCYCVLEKFIRHYTSPFQSLYLSALARGLDSALNEYRNVLVDIEAELIRKQDLNITYVSCRLHPYRLILPALCTLIKKIDHLSETQSSIRGCKILDLVITAAPPGLHGPRSLVRQLLANLMQLLCRQIHSWLMLGTLHDPHNEFFVAPISDVSALTDAENQRELSSDGFKLKVDFIPNFLSISFAQHVLFAGLSTNLILRSCPQSSIITELEENFGSKFNDLMKSFSATSDDIDMTQFTNRSTTMFDLAPLKILVSEIRSFVSQKTWRSLMEENNLITFLHAVKDVALLGRGELFLAFFDQLNSFVPSDVPDPMLSLNGKSSVTFGRGILDFPASVPPSDIASLEYGVQTAFLTAARSVGLDDEFLDSCFSLTFAPLYESKVEDEALCGHLLLEVNAPLSLKMVFSKQVCQGYGRLFRFLALVRHTQVVLQHYWAEQTLIRRRGRQFEKTIEISQSSSTKPGTLNHKTSDPFCATSRRLLIRSHMAFFVENLQYYLQVDVIESQFAHLLYRIQLDKDANLVLAAHEAFVATLQAQCLLFHPTARSCIVRLLSLCRKFVSAFPNDADAPSCLSDSEESLFCDFRQLSCVLFRCLTSSESVGAKASVGMESGLKRFDQAPCSKAALSQLLLRLDFNHFFSGMQNTTKL